MSLLEAYTKTLIALAMGTDVFKAVWRWTVGDLILSSMLNKIDPEMDCELCPSFFLDIVNGELDVRLRVFEDGSTWHMHDDQTKLRVRGKINSLRAKIKTVKDLEQFKIDMAQALIREVQAGKLYRDSKGIQGTIPRGVRRPL